MIETSSFINERNESVQIKPLNNVKSSSINDSVIDTETYLSNITDKNIGFNQDDFINSYTTDNRILEKSNLLNDFHIKQSSEKINFIKSSKNEKEETDGTADNDNDNENKDEEQEEVEEEDGESNNESKEERKISNYEEEIERTIEELMGSLSESHSSVSSLSLADITSQFKDIKFDLPLPNEDILLSPLADDLLKFHTFNLPDTRPQSRNKTAASTKQLAALNNEEKDFKSNNEFDAYIFNTEYPEYLDNIPTPENESLSRKPTLRQPKNLTNLAIPKVPDVPPILSPQYPETSPNSEVNANLPTLFRPNDFMHFKDTSNSNSNKIILRSRSAKKLKTKEDNEMFVADEEFNQSNYSLNIASKSTNALPTTDFCTSRKNLFTFIDQDPQYNQDNYLAHSAAERLTQLVYNLSSNETYEEEEVLPGGGLRKSHTTCSISSVFHSTTNLQSNVENVCGGLYLNRDCKICLNYGVLLFTDLKGKQIGKHRRVDNCIACGANANDSKVTLLAVSKNVYGKRLKKINFEVEGNAFEWAVNANREFFKDQFEQIVLKTYLLVSPNNELAVREIAKRFIHPITSSIGKDVQIVCIPNDRALRNFLLTLSLDQTDAIYFVDTKQVPSKTLNLSEWNPYNDNKVVPIINETSIWDPVDFAQDLVKTQLPISDDKIHFKTGHIMLRRSIDIQRIWGKVSKVLNINKIKPSNLL